MKEQAQNRPRNHAQNQSDERGNGGANQDIRSPVDWQEALSRVAQDEAILLELVDIFLEQWPLIMDEIEQAVARNDGTTLRRAAHTLKGSAAVFGAHPVVDLADRLSEMGRLTDFDLADRALRELQDQMERLVPALQERLSADSQP